VTAHVHLATAVAMKLPRTEKQRASSRKTIEFTRGPLKKARQKPNGNCEICGVRCFLYNDHCHITGRQRGKLCCNCNMALGMWKDNIRILAGAISYLEKHRFRFPRSEPQRFPRLSSVRVA